MATQLTLVQLNENLTTAKQELARATQQREEAQAAYKAAHELVSAALRAVSEYNSAATTAPAQPSESAAQDVPTHVVTYDGQIRQLSQPAPSAAQDVADVQQFKFGDTVADAKRGQVGIVTHVSSYLEYKSLKTGEIFAVDFEEVEYAETSRRKQPAPSAARTKRLPLTSAQIKLGVYMAAHNLCIIARDGHMWIANSEGKNEPTVNRLHYRVVDAFVKNALAARYLERKDLIRGFRYDLTELGRAALS